MTRLAEVKEQLRLAREERDRFWLALSDTIFGGPVPLKARVLKGEVEMGADRMEATILRPFGSMPLVVVTVPCLHHVEVHSIEPWVWETTGGYTLRTLRERVRVEWQRALDATRKDGTKDGVAL